MQEETTERNFVREADTGCRSACFFVTLLTQNKCLPSRSCLHSNTTHFTAQFCTAWTWLTYPMEDWCSNWGLTVPCRSTVVVTSVSEWHIQTLVWVGTKKQSNCQWWAGLTNSSTYLDRKIRPERQRPLQCGAKGALVLDQWLSETYFIVHSFFFYIYFIITCGHLLLRRYVFCIFRRIQVRVVGFILLWLKTFTFTFSEGFWSVELGSSLFFRGWFCIIMHDALCIDGLYFFGSCGLMAASNKLYVFRLFLWLCCIWLETLTEQRESGWKVFSLPLC